MKAWEFEHKLTADAVPPELHDDNEADWMAYTEAGRASDKQLFHDWDNKVPGSKAPCDVVIAAVQSMHNRGYDVTEAEKFMEEGLKASEEKDGAAIQVATAKIFHALNEAPKDPASPYWSYNTYRTFAGWKKRLISALQLSLMTSFPMTLQRKSPPDGWGQLIGGCLGTQIEGYTTEQIRKRFGEVYGYLRRPETYNDDITYEIAYLDGFIEKGWRHHACRRCLQMAGADLRRIFRREDGHRKSPPRASSAGERHNKQLLLRLDRCTDAHSASRNVSTRKPETAARLAADDSIVSHSNNGMPWIFNALLTSLKLSRRTISGPLLKKRWT